jgi:hypothetical protein
MEHRGEVVGSAQWPAIVDESLWQAARALLCDDSRRTTTGNARRWLGGGLYLCGVCSAPLRATTAGTGRKGRGYAAAYRCEHGAHVVRRCEALDQFVESVLVERLSRPDAADLGRPSTIVNTPRLHIERLAVQARLNELVDLFADGDITAQQMQRGTTTLRVRLEDLDSQLAAAGGKSALDGVTGHEVIAVWPTLDLSRRRAILDVLATVTVHRTRRGRPPGWRPGESYFDPGGIKIVWRAPKRAF